MLKLLDPCGLEAMLLAESGPEHGGGRLAVLEVHLPPDLDAASTAAEADAAARADQLAYDALQSAACPSGSAAPGRACVRGAVSVHPSYFEAAENAEKYYPNYSAPQDGNLLPDKELQSALARLGLEFGTRVVVYGRGQVPMMTASRAAWALMYAGTSWVGLLDGGFPAWVDHVTKRKGKSTCEDEEGQASQLEGLLSLQPAAPVPVAHFGAVLCRHDLLATTDQVRLISDAALGHAAHEQVGILVDVRRLDEHSGANDTYYPFFSNSGHIPGDVWQGNWDNLVDASSGKLRLEETRSRWEGLGIPIEELGRDPERSLIFYCGTGWRSTITFVIALLLGCPNVRNYDDGFFGWQYDKANIIWKDDPTASQDSSTAPVAANRQRASSENRGKECPSEDFAEG